MPALPGRDVRIAIGAVDVAGAQMDQLTVNREFIDATDKDDASVRKLLDEVGTFSVEMTVSGRMKTTALSVWAVDATEANKTMTFAVGGIENWTGDFFMTNFEIGGSDGAEAATFSATFASAGAVTRTDA